MPSIAIYRQGFLNKTSAPESPQDWEGGGGGDGGTSDEETNYRDLRTIIRDVQYRDLLAQARSLSTRGQEWDARQGRTRQDGMG
jgi:hypothetical protein